MPVVSLLQTLDAWDKGLFLFLNGSLENAFFDLLMPFITEKWNFIVPLALVFLYLFLKGGRPLRILLLLSLVLLLLADGSATLLKNLFQRARPCQVLDQVRILVGCSSSFALPSNHATNIFAIASFFAYADRRLLVPLFVLAFLVGYSRIYVGVHYPLDVLGGAVLGIALGLFISALGRRIILRWDTGGEVYPFRRYPILRWGSKAPDREK
ncbi:MAG: phosphatase PAP2 family protein [candidate division NC10 bacterium]|nr:phosphatase PAP2 family protein [candidate division NC10 bacterium]